MAEPQTPVRFRIYVSYDPARDAGPALRLIDALHHHFEPDRIVSLSDSETSTPDELKRDLERLLDSCAVSLVVIGQDWMARSARVREPHDFDRTVFEVKTLLAADEIIVIPVLVGDGIMPSASDLPGGVAPLAERTPFGLSDDEWDVQTAELRAMVAAALDAVAAREAASARARELEERLERARAAREQERQAAEERRQAEEARAAAAEEQRERERRASELLERARAALAAGDYEAAQVALAQQSSLDLAGLEAKKLRRELNERLSASLAERAALEERRVRRREGVPEVSPETSPLVFDENVQFTVFRPSTIQPERWYPLLAFAHLSERRADADPDEPDPIAEVQAKAGRALGDAIAEFRGVTQDSTHAVMRDGELRCVPRMKGVEFNPPERRFLWTESVHQEDFRIRAQASMDGHVARGTLTVYSGNLLLADVPLSIKVDRRVSASPQVQSEARPYRRIFASYSHLDTPIVEEFELHARATGDTYLRDVISLRAGEVWRDRLAEMIGQADVFQLFWSWNALGSPLVRAEWQHALALNRQHFVRPVYWEEPLPERPGLPPGELRQLHFQRVYPRRTLPEISARPKMVGGAQGPVVVVPNTLPQADAPAPPAAPQPSRTLRLIRGGSIAAAAVLAVGLYVSMFGTLSLPPTDTGQSDMPSTAPPATPTLPPAVESPAPNEAEPPAPRTEDGSTSPAPRPRPRPRPERPPAATGSGVGGGGRPASPRPRPPATEPPREPVVVLPSAPPAAQQGSAELRQDIAAVMHEYEVALTTRDIERLRRVLLLSDREAREIENLFRNAPANDVRVQVIDVTLVSEGRVTARTIESSRSAGGATFTAEREQVFQLAKRGDAWVIVAIDR
jgi:hypothetical protein